MSPPTDTHQVLTDRQQIALSDAEATRFLNALENVDEDAVARLRALRDRSKIGGIVDRPA